MNELVGGPGSWIERTSAAPQLGLDGHSQEKVSIKWLAILIVEATPISGLAKR